MKSKYLYLYKKILYILTAVILVGCNKEPITTTIKTISPTITSSPFQSSLIASHTSTRTEVSIATRTSTKTQIPTDTPTSEPTLSKNEGMTAILELLKTNAGCTLPCWWGIQPGQSTWDDTQFVFSHLGFGITYSKTYSDGVIVHSRTIPFDPYNKVFMDTFFYEINNTIVSMRIYSNGALDQSKFQGIMDTFSPQKILLNYGVPSRIWVFSSGGFIEKVDPGTKMSYRLFFFYDNLGFLIIYYGLVDYQPIYHICPYFSENGLIDSFELYMQSDKSTNPLENLTPFITKENLGALSIEEATGLSVQDLYNLYMNATGPVCFDTPRDIWK
jgi:hypothetical protein